MAAPLAEKTCTPCRGGMPPLSRDEAEYFREQATDWTLFENATRIERNYYFKNFREAFAFVERAAALAETESHHPDIGFGWGFATISLRTKKIRGLHENDFIMAAKIDRLAMAAGAQDNRGQNRRSAEAPVTSDISQSNDNRGSTLTHPS